MEGKPYSKKPKPYKEDEFDIDNLMKDMHSDDEEKEVKLEEFKNDEEF